MAEEIPEIPEESFDRGLDGIDIDTFDESVKNAQADFDAALKDGLSSANEEYAIASRKIASNVIEQITSTAAEDEKITSSEAETFFEAVDAKLPDGTGTDTEKIYNQATDFEEQNPSIAKKIQSFYKSFGSKIKSSVEKESGSKLSPAAEDAAQKVVDELGNGASANAAKLNANIEVLQKEVEKLGRKADGEGVSEIKWRIASWLILFGLAAGTVFGLMKLLRDMADDLTGCYYFQVSSSGDVNEDGPLECPSKDDPNLCSCFDSSMERITDCTVDANKPVAPCCASSGARLCSSASAGEPNSKYYAFKKVTPASALNNGINSFFNSFKQGASDLAGLLKTLLIGGGILVIVGLILFIVLKSIHK